MHRWVDTAEACWSREGASRGETDVSGHDGLQVFYAIIGTRSLG